MSAVQPLKSFRPHNPRLPARAKMSAVQPPKSFRAHSKTPPARPTGLGVTLAQQATWAGETTLERVHGWEE